MIPHNHDRLSFSSFVHDQEHITPNPYPNSQPAASTKTPKKKRNLPGNPGMCIYNFICSPWVFNKALA